MKHDLRAKDRLLPPSEQLVTRREDWRRGGRPLPRQPSVLRGWFLAAQVGLGAVLVACVGLVIGGGVAYRHYAAGLPSIDGLKSYQPPVMSRVYANDGSLMAELATERRIFAPYSDIPDLVKGAFVAAEDQNFWSDQGIDPLAIVRAGFTDLINLHSGKRPIGASTITQQVAKNMLLGSQRTMDRKIREALLAIRIDHALGKQRILELYLNEIYLGEQSYGVAAAAQTYFGKTLDQLSPGQAAFLAALPKAPNNYNPHRYPDAALARRNWVLDRMADDHLITADVAASEKLTPILPAGFSGPKLTTVDGYFAEDVRRALVSKFGADATVQSGFTVRTSLDPRLQTIGETVLRDGLMKYDRAHDGWRGPVAHLAAIGDGAWQAGLAHVPTPGGMLPSWRLAVVLNIAGGAAELGTLDPGTDGGPAVPGRMSLPFSGLGWAHFVAGFHVGAALRRIGDVVSPGDVVMVQASDSDPGRAVLRQVPLIEGGLVSLDPRTGRVLALVGGWKFTNSQFDRVTQAARQPGSSFKPIVYLAAMEQNILPTQTFLDAPFVLNTKQGQWRPEDYESGFEGPVELRTALEQSLNLVTIRVADHIGMQNVANTAIALHVVDKMSLYLPNSIGAIDSTILRMAAAYADLDEGGREVTPSLIDSVQDRDGHTVWTNQGLTCEACDSNDPDHPPDVVDSRATVADPQSVYQVVQMMQGVVQRGTGVPAGQGLGRPIAGKTGTTQEFRDAWFIGFTPNVVTAVWFGYDNPQSLGDKETGGAVAAPVFHDFMQEALAGQPALPFTPPAGMFIVANPAGGNDAFKSTEDPNAQITLLTDTGDATDNTDAADQAPMPPPGTAPPPSATIDTNVGGVY